MVHTPEAAGKPGSHNLAPAEIAQLTKEGVDAVLGWAIPAYQDPQAGRPVMKEDYRIEGPDDKPSIIGYLQRRFEVVPSEHPKVYWVRAGEEVVQPDAATLAGLEARLQELKAQGAKGSSTAVFMAVHPDSGEQLVIQAAHQQFEYDAAPIYSVKVFTTDPQAISTHLRVIPAHNDVHFGGANPRQATSAAEVLALLQQGLPPVE